MKKKKVIIDTDAGWDDVLSILYLLKNPTIEIIGITITGCGETDLRWGQIIIKTLMELGGRTNTIICLGTSTPLSFDHVFPQDFKNDMNDVMGLLGSLNPQENINIGKESAWDFIANTLEQSNEKITILSLGGFTNLAKMLDTYPKAHIEKIENLYAMGGAVHVDGNVADLNNAKSKWNQGSIYSGNYVAEWNVFIDPLAAKKVFDSVIPLVLVPLDACYYVVLDTGYIDKITAKDPIAVLAKNIFIRKNGSSNEGIPVPIFDPLATMIASGDLKNYFSREDYLDVELIETQENNRCGNTYVTNCGSRKITIIGGVSKYEFSNNFIETINA